ncbi:MAG: SPOR domain-containing protein [Rhodobacteraceae bacterium]|nr:SPOR domain-containing protein [Paracoccaceae bacterium]
MADLSYDRRTAHGSGADSGAPSFQTIANVAGAIISLALVIGIAIWGYKLLMRDVSGVPVVRALDAPMREAPKDPGGRPADHQGLAVNAVAATGNAAPPADRLVLAPRALDLADEDMPMARLQAAPAGEDIARQTGATALRGASVDALVDELIDETQPDAIVQPEPLGDPVAETPAPDAAPSAEAPAVLDAPGVRRSPRPPARPDAVFAARTAAGAPGTAGAEAAVNADAGPAAGADVIDIDPASLPVGTRLAQLGAYDSPELARQVWDQMAVNFSDYLIGKKRVIQRASSGGRVFYRLRAQGFADLSEARRFCSALVAEGADCIPVTTR